MRLHQHTCRSPGNYPSRLGQVEDVTNAFLFFCDPANSFVTGQTLFVCGGSSIGTLTL